MKDARWIPAGPPRRGEQTTTPAEALAEIAADNAETKAARKAARKVKR